MNSSTPGSGEVLAQRYGSGHRTVTRTAHRGPGTRGWLLITAVAVVVSAAFVAWIVLGSSSQPEFKDVSFEVQDAGHAHADFDLTKDPDQQVTCAVRALNEQYAVVGWTEVTFGTLDPDQVKGRTSTHRVPLRTTNLATTAGVDSCWSTD